MTLLLSLQTDRWWKQFQASMAALGVPPSPSPSTSSGSGMPGETAQWHSQMGTLHAWLKAHIPPHDSAPRGPTKGLVHGDFRLDNLVFHPTEVSCRCSTGGCLTIDTPQYNALRVTTLQYNSIAWRVKAPPQHPIFQPTKVSCQHFTLKCFEMTIMVQEHKVLAIQFISSLS